MYQKKSKLVCPEGTDYVKINYSQSTFCADGEKSELQVHNLP